MATKLPRGIDEPTPGEYRVRISLDGRRHVVGRYTRLQDARVALDLARADKIRGTFVAPAQKREQRRAAEVKATADAYTVRELADDFLAGLARRGRTVSTIYNYRSRLTNHLLPQLGDRPVTAVTPREIAEWHADLVARKGDGVARQVFLTTSSMFAWATGKDEGPGFTPKLDVSPVRIPGANKPKPVRKQGRRVASADEIALIADAMPPRERLAVLLAGHCGLRQGEVLGLRRGDLTLPPTSNPGTVGWITVTRQVQAKGLGLYETTPKTEQGKRDVPIPADLVPVVRSHVKDFVAPGAEALVFPRRDFGNEWTHPNVLRRHFTAARDALNTSRAADKLPVLEGFRFHDLRHTALSRLGESGATLSELMTFGGHRRIETVQVYQHSSRDRLAALAAKLNISVTTSATVVDLDARRDAQ